MSRPESAQAFWYSAEGDCTDCRVQCSLCCKWRIVTYEALQQVCKATSWTCFQLRSAPSISGWQLSSAIITPIMSKAKSRVLLGFGSASIPRLGLVWWECIAS